MITATTRTGTVVHLVLWHRSRIAICGAKRVKVKLGSEANCPRCMGSPLLAMKLENERLKKEA